jgi:serine/threonine protein kinase
MCHWQANSYELLKLNLQGFRKEALTWRQFTHPNALPFLGIYHLEDPRPRLCLVSPWMENGNIANYLEANPFGINRLTLVSA